MPGLDTCLLQFKRLTRTKRTSGIASLRFILSSPNFSSLTTLTRRPLEAPAGSAGRGPSYVNKVVDFDRPDAWALAEAYGSSAAKVFVSCLGTTKAQAGSIDAQRKIDLDLNLTLAQAARDAGADTVRRVSRFTVEALGASTGSLMTESSLSLQYILVSSGAASSTSYSPYLQMKGKLEDSVKAMSFRSVYILQPGLLMGARTESRTAEGLTQSLFRGLGRLGLPVAKYSVEADECVVQWLLSATVYAE